MIRTAAALAILAAPAAAQGTTCLSRSDMVSALTDTYGETVQMIGSSRGGQLVVEMWGRPGGSWTVVVTSPDGVACILAAGEDFTVTGGGEAL